MASFLTDAEKAAVNAVMDNLHDTFARDITVYKDGQIVTINSSDYNGYYGRRTGGASPTTTEVVSETFKARILYGKPDSEFLSSAEIDSQLKIDILASTVRLKVNEEARNYLAEAKLVEFDGQTFKIIPDIRPHGVFSPHYYTFFLTPIDSD